jgi:hypothetical protein
MSDASTPAPDRLLLYVVDRDRRDIYDVLTANFADTPHIEVILDRRVGERRRLTGMAISPERRRGERRNTSGSHAIAAGDGWTLFRVRRPTA